MVEEYEYISFGCSKFGLQDLDIIHIGVSCTKELYTYANQMWKCYEPLALSLLHDFVPSTLKGNRLQDPNIINKS